MTSKHHMGCGYRMSQHGDPCTCKQPDMTDRDTNKIIGLVGYPGSGKDSLARVQVEKHRYMRVGFADAIKEMLIAIDPTYESRGIELGMTPLECLEYFKRQPGSQCRVMLQRLGKYMRDTEGEDYWVDKAFYAVGGYDLMHNTVIFTDVRYQNEFDVIKRSGGTIVGITRTGCGPVNDHESESNTGMLLEQADIALTNNDTIKHLVAKFITCV